MIGAVFNESLNICVNHEVNVDEASLSFAVACTELCCRKPRHGQSCAVEGLLTPIPIGARRGLWIGGVVEVDRGVSP